MTERTRSSSRSNDVPNGDSRELLELAIEAHGGHARWQEVTRITAALSAGGVLWASRGQAGALDDVSVTIDTRNESCSIAGLAGPDRRGVFTPGRVAIETADGALVQELRDPRRAFHPGVDAPWGALELAYFAGYALWTYLTVPFLLAEPGFRTEEIEPWEEHGEMRRRLRARFPSHIVSHSAEQVFHFGPDGLLRRHDYTPELLLGNPGHLAIAHYTSDHQRFEGISFPTRRHAIALTPDGRATPEPVLVSIDISRVSIE
jgi:hypothetical protein